MIEKVSSFLNEFKFEDIPKVLKVLLLILFTKQKD